MVNTNTTTVNNGKWNFLEYFSTYLAGVVLYKVVFAALHLIRYRFRYYCYDDLKGQNHDLAKEYKRMKKANPKNKIQYDDKSQKTRSAMDEKSLLDQEE